MTASTTTPLETLREHLQTAIEIEWSTIPPYLCALWSLADGPNEYVAGNVEEVAMEEMLHLTLACNLLNAIGGRPRLVPDPVTQLPQPPSYPTYLPHSDDAFLVNLLPFSSEALETFCLIERPAAPGAPPEPGRYRTIAQFYAAVRELLDELGPDIFTGPPERQVDQRYYYGSGGEATAIHDRPSADGALEVIVDQGEGIPGESIWDADENVFGEGGELAHYFVFDELHRGRRYTKDDTPSSGPTGDPILLDYGSVLPMRPNPKAEDYAEGTELRELTETCNATYSRMLVELDDAFNGEPSRLVVAVQTMLQLRSESLALMRIPLGDGSGLNAGPAFQWRARTAT